MYYGRDYITYLDAAAHPEKYPSLSKKPPLPAREEDIALILEYMEYQAGITAMAPGSAKTTANTLLQFARESPCLTDISTNDVLKTISVLRKKKSASTMVRLIATVKRFCQWQKKVKKNKKINLETILEIKPPKPESTRTAEKMLNADEINKIIAGGRSSRDRALIAMSYEGSARPIEISDARWNELKFDQYGASWNTSGKTGKARYIRLIMSAPYLKTWRNDYPGDPSGDAPVFVSERRAKHQPKDAPHKFLTQSGIRVIISKAVKNSGVKKNVFPYLFRHSRITHAIADGVPDSIVKRQAWGHLKTNQLATYAHLVDEDVDRVMLEKAGIKAAPREDAGVKPLQCPHCGTINKTTSKFCDECGNPLTKEASKSREQAVRVADNAAGDMSNDQVTRIAQRVLELQREAQKELKK